MAGARAIVAGWLACATAIAVEPSPWGEAAGAEVTLVYTGATGGVGLGRYTFELPGRLRDAFAEVDARVVRTEVLHAVLDQGPHNLWPDDGTAASMFAFAEAGEPVCGPPSPARRLGTAHEEAVLTGIAGVTALISLPGAAETGGVLRRCEAGGAVAWWLGPASVDPPAWTLDAWDVRLGTRLHVEVDGDALTVPILGLPRQEATRRFRLLSDLLAADDDALFVDAGDFLDGASSVRPGALSIHRSTGLSMLERLRPTALVPGASELAPGARHLLGEARARGLPYVVTNWTAPSPDLAMPWVIRRLVGTGEAQADVAFLGVVDPDVLRSTARLQAEKVALRDPAEALLEAVDRLVLSDRPPDVVVVLGQLSPARLASVRQRVHGVDLIVGDRTAATLRVMQQETDLRAVDALDKAAPLSVPLDGVGVARLRLKDGRLAAVRVVPVPVTADMPSDAGVTARVTRVRAVTYPGRDLPVVPAPPDDPVGVVSDEAFGGLACDAVRAIAGADLAYLAALPDAVRPPGAVSALLAAERLRVLDRIEVHRIDGSRLKELLDRAEGEVATRCGVTGSQVGGRAIDPDRVYRLATTDRTRLTTRLGELMEATYGGRLGERPSWVPLRDDDGQDLSLQAAVLRAWSVRAARPDGRAARVLAQRSARRPMWSLDLTKLALDVSRFEGTGRPELASVPDAQANNPSALSVGTDVNAAVVYDSPGATVEARARLLYQAITVDDASPTESADDVQLALAAGLPLAAFPRGSAGFRMQPFGELLWDSEFTPVVADGVAQAIQSDLFVTLGLSASTGPLKRLRVGAFANQDLARVGDKPAEFGGRLDLEASWRLPPASSLRFDTAWDLRVWGDTPQDDATDLRVRLLGEVRLLAQPVRVVSAGVFVRGYLAQGRTPETDVVGFSWTVGGTLQVNADVVLSRPLSRRVPRAWRARGDAP